MAEKFTSHLKVDKKIVELLSKQTYQKSFSAAIRELISNAYDADALSVQVNYDKNFSYIEILDDGNGMTKNEFEKYLTIAGTKQDNPLSRKYKRKKIGQFGVGFLSIFPFCESLEITTSSANSSDVLKATIPTKHYFGNNTKTNKKEGDFLVDDIPITGTISNNPSEKLDHYTKIRLLNPTHIVKQYFSKPNTNKRDSVVAHDPIEKFKWELQEDLPLSLPENSKYYKSYKYPEPIGMKVFLNGQDLFRNDYLENILDHGEIVVSGIRCKYIITTDYKSVKPMEFRGIKMRVNNVGIGPRTDFFLKRDRGFSRLHWLTGEVFFSEEMKEHLNIGRDGFIAHPVTDEVFEVFSNKLRMAANDVEAIAVAEKEITKITKSQKAPADKPKKEVLAANIKKLESKGFQVIESTNPSSKDKEIIVDRKEKTIVIPKAVYDEKETITILDRNYEITYERWAIDDLSPACRFLSTNKIALNQNYPLFHSKSTGNVFKRMHLMLLVATQSTKTAKEALDIINKNILTEFKDYL